MQFTIEPTVIAAFVAVCGVVGPAFYFLGRLSKRVDATEKGIELLTTFQKEMIQELRGIRSDLSNLGGRFEASENVKQRRN